MPSGEYTGGIHLPGGFDGSSGTIPGGYSFQTQFEDPKQRDRTLNVEIQNRSAAMLPYQTPKKLNQIFLRRHKSIL